MNNLCICPTVTLFHLSSISTPPLTRYTVNSHTHTWHWHGSLHFWMDMILIWWLSPCWPYSLFTMLSLLILPWKSPGKETRKSWRGHAFYELIFPLPLRSWCPKLIFVYSGLLCVQWIAGCLSGCSMQNANSKSATQKTAILHCYLAGAFCSQTTISQFACTYVAGVCYVACISLHLGLIVYCLPDAFIVLGKGSTPMKSAVFVCVCLHALHVCVLILKASVQGFVCLWPQALPWQVSIRFPVLSCECTLGGLPHSDEGAWLLPII